MPTSLTHTPGYRRQSFKSKRGKPKRADLAFVEVNGERRYLGVYGSPESREEYDRVIAEYLAHGRVVSTKKISLTIINLAADYLRWAEKDYTRQDGSVSPQLSIVRHVIARIVKLYGSTPVEEFGPLK